MSKAKKIEKNLKKGIDFSILIWYIIKAPRERGSARAPEADEKNFKKKKKVVDKGKRV